MRLCQREPTEISSSVGLCTSNAIVLEANDVASDGGPSVLPKAPADTVRAERSTLAAEDANAPGLGVKSLGAVTRAN